MIADIPDDIWCASCGERPRTNEYSLCQECADAEFGDVEWVTGPDGTTQMTEEQAVAQALNILGVNRASLRRQERAKRKRGKGYTR